jgi:mono/diheme cytochrome c family protein
MSNQHRIARQAARRLAGFHGRLSQRFRWLAPVALTGLVAACAAPPPPQTPVERGRYLVESILGCGNCHTPKDAHGAPIDALNLSGGSVRINVRSFTVIATNITPDSDTGIGRWTDTEIKRAIVEGMRPAHGRLPNTQLAPVMAIGFFKAMLPEDLDAVVAYLRSVKPIRNEVALPVYRARVPFEKYPEAEKGFTAAQMTDPVQRGRYLATIGHCMECHSPRDKGAVDYSKLGKGGQGFNSSFIEGLPKEWPGAVARNITSHRAAGIGAWSDAEIKRAITQGVSRDGRKLQQPMGYSYYARMTETDLDALVAYLRTVPAQE